MVLRQIIYLVVLHIILKTCEESEKDLYFATIMFWNLTYNFEAKVRKRIPMVKITKYPTPLNKIITNVKEYARPENDKDSGKRRRLKQHVKTEPFVNSSF